MSRAIINESSLTAIGNAIRTKTGGTDKLSVPTGMVDAINGIQTDGGTLKIQRLTFSDYGNRIYKASGVKSVFNGNFDLNNCIIFYAVKYSGQTDWTRCAYYRGYKYRLLHPNSIYINEGVSISDYESQPSEDFSDTSWFHASGIIGHANSSPTTRVSYDDSESGVITIDTSDDDGDVMHIYAKVLYVG